MGYDKGECIACITTGGGNRSASKRYICGICFENIMSNGCTDRYNKGFRGFGETFDGSQACDKCHYARNILFIFPICSRHMGYSEKSDNDDDDDYVY